MGLFTRTHLNHRISCPLGRLDDSEFIIGAREGSKLGSNHVHFYGKLEIQSLDWLSDQGRRWLEMDLRQRDREIHFEHALNGLTLIEVYGGKNSGMKITVWIQCEKSMQVKFLGGYIQCWVTSFEHPCV